MNLSTMTADAIKKMRSLTGEGAKFATAAAAAVSGETKTVVPKGEAKASAKAPDTKLKADAKVWKSSKEWKCWSCRNVNSKLVTTCVGCEFDNLTILECKFCKNKQPAIVGMCLKCSKPMIRSV